MLSIGNNESFMKEILGGAYMTQSADITFVDGSTISLTADDFSVTGNTLFDGAGASTFPLGYALQKVINLNIFNVDDKFSIQDFFDATVRLYSKYESTTVDLGTYTITDATTADDVITITMGDRMCFSDVTFTPEFDAEKVEAGCTLGQLFAHCCAFIGVTPRSRTFFNSDFEVKVLPTDCTFRQVFGWIAQLAGGNIRIGYDGKLDVLTYDFSVLNGSAYSVQTLSDDEEYNPRWSNPSSFDGGTYSFMDGSVLDGGSYSWLDGASVDGGDYVSSGSGTTDPDNPPYNPPVNPDNPPVNPSEPDNPTDPDNPDNPNIRSDLPVLKQWINLDVAVDDIVITGVKATKTITVEVEPDEDVSAQAEEDEEDDTIDDEPQEPQTEDKTIEILEGDEGYVISIAENMLIKDNEDEAAKSVASLLIGGRMRHFSGEHHNNPALEFMDPVQIVDKKGNVYTTFITDVNYTWFGTTTFSNSVEANMRNNSQYQMTPSQVITKTKELISSDQKRRDAFYRQLAEELAAKNGLFMTKVVLDDGSIIYYMHNKNDEPDENGVFPESNIVWKMNANAIGVSTDGGKTYPYILDASGNAALNEILANGIDSKYIIVGDSTLTETITTLQKSIDDVESSNRTVAYVDVEYAMNSSSTNPPQTGWDTDAPTWQQGQYIWQRTVTYYTDNSTPTYSDAVCINGTTGEPGKDGDPGDPGRGILKIEEQYYLSTSNTTQTGGSWSTTQPAYVSGRYYWIRSKITWDDNTVTYTDPVLAGGLNSANQNADSANSEVKIVKENITRFEVAQGQISSRVAEIETRTSMNTKNLLKQNYGLYREDGPTAFLYVPANQNSYINIATKEETISEGTIVGYTRLTRKSTTTSTTYGVGIPIREHLESGKSYTLSLRVRKSATGNITSMLAYNISSTSATTRALRTFSYTTANTWTTLTYTFTADDTMEGAANLHIVFTTNSISANSGTMDIQWIQLEEGTTNTPFVDGSNLEERIKRNETSILQNAKEIEMSVKTERDTGILRLGENSSGTGVAFTVDSTNFKIDENGNAILGDGVNYFQVTGTGLKGLQKIARFKIRITGSSSTINFNSTYNIASFSLTGDSGSFSKRSSSSSESILNDIKEVNQKFIKVEIEHVNQYNIDIVIDSLDTSKTNLASQFGLGTSVSNLNIVVYNASGTGYTFNVTNNITYASIDGAVSGTNIDFSSVQTRRIYSDLQRLEVGSDLKFDSTKYLLLGKKTRTFNDGNWGIRMHPNGTIQIAGKDETNPVIYFSSGDMTKATSSITDYAQLSTSTAKRGLEIKSLNRVSIINDVTQGQVFFFNDYTNTPRMPVASIHEANRRVAYLGTNISSDKNVVQARVRWPNGGYGENSVDGYTTVNLYTATSDIRLKENVKDSQVNALNILNNIKCREFDWKYGGTHQVIGFIADELELIDKRIVDQCDEDSYKTIDTFYMMGYVVKAIQELKEELEELKRESKHH